MTSISFVSESMLVVFLSGQLSVSVLVILGALVVLAAQDGWVALDVQVALIVRVARGALIV